MSIQIQMRGGTTLEHAAFKGASREITCDTDKKTLVVHDGQTFGGFPLAREDFANLPPATWELLRAFIEDKQIGSVVAAPLDGMDGYLLCDGSAVSREAFAPLFSHIGIAFGYGDGVETFNIPDYRGAFLRGRGGSSAEDFATLQLDAAPNFNGSVVGPTWYNAVPILGGTGDVENTSAGPNPSGSANTGPSGTYGTYSSGGKIDLSHASPSYGRDNTVEIRPRNFAINYFIKY